MALEVLDPSDDTLAALDQQPGGIPLDRILLRPPPGTATIEDALAEHDSTDRICELIDGTLFAKHKGLSESFLACWLLWQVNMHVCAHNLGVMTGGTGPFLLAPGLMCIPDLAFTSWDRLPGRRIPREPVGAFAPDLAIEMLSDSNTGAEMERKRREYFRAGVRLVWLVDHRSRTIQVYNATDRSVVLTTDDTLTADPVLPGFSLPLRDLFGELDRHG